MNATASAKTALIVGASRGLGLGLTHELAGRGWEVTATTRGSTEAPPGVTVKTLEINDNQAAAAFVDELNGAVFDVVFINAGIGGPKNFDTAPEAEIAHVFMTNAVSPVRLAERLTPMLRPHTGVLAFMTSVMGSIESNVNGAPALYGASKAALNHLTRGFVEALPKEKGITVLSMHPGWVRTDMGGQHAPLDVATSVKGMADVLERQAGKGGLAYLDYEGKTIPW